MKQKMWDMFLGEENLKKIQDSVQKLASSMGKKPVQEQPEQEQPEQMVQPQQPQQEAPQYKYGQQAARREYMPRNFKESNYDKQVDWTGGDWLAEGANVINKFGATRGPSVRRFQRAEMLGTMENTEDENKQSVAKMLMGTMLEKKRKQKRKEAQEYGE